jgi:hypothetical protein
MPFRVYVTQGQGEAFCGEFLTREEAENFMKDHKGEGSFRYTKVVPIETSN